MAPTDLDGVLIPTYAVGIFVAQIALTAWLVSFPVHIVLGGGDRLAHAATGLLVSYAILGLSGAPPAPLRAGDLAQANLGGE